MNEEQASLFVAMARSPAGKLYLQKLQRDFDTTVVAMLYAPVHELQSLQGKARALHEQLSVFESAETIVSKGQR